MDRARPASMRFSIVVAPDYRSSPGLPVLPSAAVQAATIRRRLAVEDLGFVAEQVAGDRELPEALEARLTGLEGRVSSAVFYFNGHLVWQPGRAPALALAAARPRAYPVPRLCALLERHCDEYLLLLDATLAGDGAQRGAVVDALGEVLAEHAPRASGLLAVAPGPPLGASGALTERLLTALDSPAAVSPSATVGELFAHLTNGGPHGQPPLELRGVPSAPGFALFARDGGATRRPRPSLRDSLSPAPPPAADPRVAAYQAALAARAADAAQRQDWPTLAAAYEAMLDGTPLAEAPEIARWLAAYYRNLCREPARARHALERAAVAAPTDVGLRLELADACVEQGELGSALDQVLAAVALEPREPDCYRRLVTLAMRTGERDRAFTAASVLGHLGATDPDPAALVTEHRPAGLQLASATLDEAHWRQELAPPVRYAALEQVLSTIAAAATEYAIQQAQRPRRRPLVDASQRQDPKTSTTTLCRSLTWTARLLGIPAPELYVEPSDEATMTALPLPQPTTRVSKAFASGLTLPELAFLWGRHLTYFRPEYSLFVYYPTLDAMTDVLMASLWAAAWDPKRLRGEDQATSRLAAHLHRALDPMALTALRAATQNLTAARGRRRVQSFTEAIDRVANRAGLVACGDIDVAARMIERFPVETAVADPIGDLLAFSVSPAHAKLRAHLGVAVGSPP